ncbi:thymidine phosphorylase [Thalassotalea profundi]|uniref:Thymidine phosphorylase n=1 Tax=Thalassotalea profundi TaxID=2036687 RepID=A0ABQ3IF98_9GAMM|nr:thymidine phosphorylase [Thalassotalea profundi]GHE82377.1 thymidine phosphorylase [Thalassotalea profundi]
MFLPQEIIRTKRNGGNLSLAQIQDFVSGLVTGEFNDAQVGSMAMAIYQQGMSTDEIVNLTMAMKNSGDVLTWDELDGPVIDKHSTGGVGDKVSFMLAAIVGACGAYVPMISGRGLGHTGGTSDKLESIAGFNVQPSIELFKKTVKELRIAIISQTDNLAPADKRLYSIRDVTATVESIPLITASILSKKLSAGLDALVMDVKYGNGAMMSSMDDASALAQSIVNVANGAGVNTQAIITDMNQVLGTTAGNALEIYETVKYLTGKQREPRLHAVVLSLAKAMLINAQIATDEKDALERINNVLDSGSAAELFETMIYTLGGPIDLLDNPWGAMQKANHIVEILAPEHGYISAMQTRDIGMAIVAMKGGRLANGQPIDHSVGFDRILPVGTLLNRGDIVARVHASSESEAKLASKTYLDSLTISESEPEPTPVIYQTIS